MIRLIRMISDETEEVLVYRISVDGKLRTVLGLGRQRLARVVLVIGRYHVALRAFERSVVRHQFRVGDAAVARGAFFGRVRSRGTVRVVAGHARLAGIVHPGNDLRKSRGARRITPR